MKITKAHIDQPLRLLDPDDIDISDLSDPEHVLMKISCRAYDPAGDMFAGQHENGSPGIELDFVVSHTKQPWLTLYEGEEVPHVYPNIEAARGALLTALQEKVGDAEAAVSAYRHSIEKRTA